MGYKSDAQRKAVHASKADGGKGNPNKKTPAKMANDRKMKRKVKRALKKSNITVSDPNNVTPKPDGPNWINPPQMKQKKSKKTFSPQSYLDKIAQDDFGKPKKMNKRKLKKLQGEFDKAFSYSGDSPAMRKLSASCKAAARRKFDVYPSAYANMWASKQQGKGKC